MSTNLPFEIEYKFLIEMPDLAKLRKSPGYREMKLTQMYLSLPHGFGAFGSGCRIRKIEEDSKTTFVKTFKRDIPSDSDSGALTRVEVEDKITEGEYISLSRFTRQGTAPVEKTRITFLYENHTLEVDIFPFWQDKAFLEIEVESRDVLPPIPDFIKVIKDVSLDKDYRNSALAVRIFEQSLT